MASSGVGFEEKLDAIKKHSHNLGKATTMIQIAKVSVEAMRQVIGAEFISFQRVEGGDLVTVHTYPPVEYIRMPIEGPGITTQAARTRMPVLVDDTLTDKAYFENKVGTRSELAVPVLVEGETAAIINVESLRPNQFTKDDQLVMEVFAEDVALTISKINISIDAMRAEERFKGVIEVFPDPLFINKNGRFAYVNQKLVELLEYDSAEDLIGRFVLKSFHPSTREMIANRGRRRLLGEDVETRYMATMVTETGKPVELETNVRVITFDGGPAILCTMRDMTEQRRYQRRLEALHSHSVQLENIDNLLDVAKHTSSIIKEGLGYEFSEFSLVTENTIIFISPDGAISPETKKLDGNTASAVASRTQETMYLSDVELVKDFELITARQGSMLLVPVVIDEHTVALLNVMDSEKDAFSDEDVRIIETLATHVGTSIRRIRHMEDLEALIYERTKELQESYELLKELDEMKNSFIATATHELRTPITAITGYIELINTGDFGEIPESIDNMLEVVDRNAKRLHNLTNELLDQQRITTNRLDLNVNPEEINELIEHAVNEITPLSEQKEQKIGLKLEKNVPTLMLDRIRITQVLVNLLNNAIKFSPVGSEIVVSSGMVMGEVMVEVKDKGIGLSKTDIVQLFKPFPNIRKERPYQSTGLGLSICKGIIDSHNGKIWVKSRGKGQGASFFFSLPVPVEG